MRFCYSCFASLIVSTTLVQAQIVNKPKENESFIRTLLEEAQSSRINVVMLGDSNQLFGGTGWDYGISKTLDQRYGTYATGLMWLGENRGNGAGVGYNCNVSANASSGVFYYDGFANDSFDPFFAGMVPCNTISLLAGDTLVSVGITLHGGSNIYQSGDNLRGDMWVKTLSSNALINPQFRLGSPPYTVYTNYNGSINQTAGLQQLTLNYQAVSNANALDFRIGSQTFAQYQGYCARVTNQNRTSGVSTTTMYGNGGQSSLDLAKTLRDLPDSFLINYFDTIKQQGNKVVVTIYMGLNDRNETVPSIKNLYPGGSMESYYDNMSYIVAVVSEALDYGNIQGDYEIVVVTPHPISSPNDLQLESYISIVNNKLQRPHLRIVNMTSLTSYAEMVSNGWYANQNDRYHLSQSGYEALSTRLIDYLLNN